MADGQRERLAVLKHESASKRLHPGHELDQCLERARVRPVLTGQEPVTGSLENRQLLYLARDLGDKLHRAGAGANHRDPLAGQIVVVVPIGGVEGVSLKRVAALDARDRRFVELAGGDHDRVRFVGLTLLGAHVPPTSRVVPATRCHAAARHDQPVDSELVGDLVHVVEDLLLRRTQPRPVAPLGVGEGIQVARDVAGSARIAVVEPGAAEVARLFEERHVGDPVPCQFDRGRDPAEPCTDDDHPHELRRR